jgi:hypothetical protein
MKKTLAELFMKSRGKPIEYNGITVHSAVFRHVKKPGRFMVRFIKAKPEPIQALRINIDKGGALTIRELADIERGDPKIILRLDTCPDVAEVVYRPSPQGGRLTFYNAWIDENDQIDAWVMHAGMIVEETEKKILLACSDGIGEPSFDDLIVEIEFLDD